MHIVGLVVLRALITMLSYILIYLYYIKNLGFPQWFFQFYLLNAS